MYRHIWHGLGLNEFPLFRSWKREYRKGTSAGRRVIVAALLVAALFGVTGIDVSAAPQTICPVSAKPIDRTCFVDYEGKRIYFDDTFSRDVFIESPLHYMSLLAKQGITLDDAPSSPAGGADTALQGKFIMQFNEESQISRRYEEFAAQAQADGYPQVARLYRAAAEAEKVHAKLLAALMGLVRSTEKNLAYSKDFELYVNREILPASRALAEKEGDLPATMVYSKFQGACAVHAKLFDEALRTIKSGRDIADLPIHVCPVCGNIIIGGLPEKCPVCRADSSRFIAIQ